MPRRRKDMDWCVIDTKAEPPILLCTRCDGTWAFPLPMRCEAAAAFLNAFSIQHKYCKPKEAPHA